MAVRIWGDEGQIAVKNIIFQYCLWKYYKPTEYLDIDVHTPATGVLFYKWTRHSDSLGKKTALTASQSITIWTVRKSKLNPGKTWVCILPNDRMDKAEFYGEQTE